MEASSRSGFTPLMAAAFTGKCEVVEYLLAEGADPNCVDEYGNNALMISLLLKHSDVAEELIKAGPGVSIQNTQGDTPWSIASAGGNRKIMRLLEEAGVKPPRRIAPIVIGAAVVVGLALLTYGVVLVKRRSSQTMVASTAKPTWLTRISTRRIAIILNVVQFSFGAMFVSSRGLPTDRIEWIVLAIWFVVPLTNLAALSRLKRNNAR